jgi:hypothetical protein
MLEKRLSIGIIIVLIGLTIFSIVGAVICGAVHPVFIAVISAIIAFTMWNQDIKKA